MTRADHVTLTRDASAFPQRETQPSRGKHPNVSASHPNKLLTLNPLCFRRHWGCLTSKVFANLQNDAPNPDDVDGFEDLRPDDQERIRKAYEDGGSE